MSLFYSPLLFDFFRSRILMRLQFFFFLSVSSFFHSAYCVQVVANGKISFIFKAE